MDESRAADQAISAETEARSRAAAGVSRRAVLAGGGFVVAVAAGAGVAVGVLGTSRPDGRPEAPAELVDALRAELTLMADIDASLAADPARRGELAPVRADHAAHAAALRSLIADYAGPAVEPGTPSARPVDRAGLRAAERAASTRASDRAALLRGRNAALLASIAACEASHAELLS